MGRQEQGDGYSSEDRNLLRVIEGQSVFPCTPGDAARLMGTSVQRVMAMASLLSHGGLLAIHRGPTGARNVYYQVTDAGRRELADHRTRMFLVEVDDRMADEIATALAQGVDGVKDVIDHGQGCCCQHCPHGGNCR